MHDPIFFTDFQRPWVFSVPSVRAGRNTFADQNMRRSPPSWSANPARNSLDKVQHGYFSGVQPALGGF